jgi:hypothetical protein
VHVAKVRGKSIMRQVNLSLVVQLDLTITWVQAYVLQVPILVRNVRLARGVGPWTW